MDFFDFSAEALYFDEPVSPAVDALLHAAAAQYGEANAELPLLRAYFYEPEHLTVLVALYRYFYYQQRYEDALRVADQAIAISLARLNLPPRWQELTELEVAQAAAQSMTLTRFLLLALKGASYLLLRLGDAKNALARLEKLAELDTKQRLGITELLALARSAVAEAVVEQVGGNVRFLKPKT
ncbi:hypothetical protein CKO09_11100 [Chromatium weissei]|nr:hypothetical protein [Chromatium weissei]